MSCRGFLPLLAGLVVLALTARASADGSSPLFQPPHRPDVPAVQNKSWCVNPIDAFVLARLEAAGLTPSPRADKLRLLRRVTFDLTGLPPTLDEQDAFLARRLAGRLREGGGPSAGLARTTANAGRSTGSTSVRYAETDGFKADDLRPEAYRYRDYVIRSFNADLPYDRFVRQQLAGDELEPDNPDAIIATGFNRLWPDEYNAANLEQRRQEILDDVTDTTGLAFLGMTFGCARCHDHKFDPIPQTDYYRLQAFFAPMRPRDDVPALDAAARKEYQARLAAWEDATKDIREEMDALVADKREEARRGRPDEVPRRDPAGRTDAAGQTHSVSGDNRADGGAADGPAPRRTRRRSCRTTRRSAIRNWNRSWPPSSRAGRNRRRWR